MSSIKRELVLSFFLGGLVVVGALAWGNPYTADASGVAIAQTQDKPAQPQDQPKAATFTGTIVQDGDQFLLKDTAGQTYRLDDQDSAKPFAGKTVKVIGQLDEDAKLIHVVSIEPLAA
ncbi:MAG: DUF5818 domain-containing protein [Terracidiphilus sp.]|jgi:hypothetical protein